RDFHVTGVQTCALPIYYPILSLEAPRARFKAEIATSIATLALADLPYREVISGLPPPAARTITRTPSYSYTDVLHHVARVGAARSEEHTSELQSRENLV